MSGIDDVLEGMAGGQGGGLGDLLGGLAGATGSGGGLDDIIGALTGSGSDTRGNAPGGLGGLLGSLLPAMGALLAGGGLQKVLAGLQANGLEAQTKSWLGPGDNKPISGTDVRNAVGEEQLAKIAGQLGISEDDAAAAVAQILPAVVDRVSPDGKLPPADQLDPALRALGQTEDNTQETQETG
jgi:uncharacterized protein YidB (DUF937 family)